MATKKIEYYEELDPTFISQMEKYTREHKANADYAFMNSQLRFAKHLLKLLDEHGIEVTNGRPRFDEEPYKHW